MANDPTKIQAGPCSLTFNSVALGHTQEGVKFTAKDVFRDRIVDAYGTSKVDKVYTGTEVTVVATITQWEIANLKIAYPLYAAGSTYISLGGTPGTTLSTYAAILTIHPLTESGTDKDITVHKAVVADVGEIGFTNDNDRVFQVTFEGLVDYDNAAGDYLVQIASDD